MNGDVILAVAAIAGAGGWAVSLWLHPYARCFACRGGDRGRNPGSTERVWGRCLVCKGSGERLRAGARWVHPDLRRK